MEGFQNLVQKVTKDAKAAVASLPENPYTFSGKAATVGGGRGGGGGGGVSNSAVSYSDQSHVLIARPPRNAISLLTCSKLCAIFFVCGVVVGYTLKKRVRRWASKLLRRLKDD